jgi:hypothetical protein
MKKSLLLFALVLSVAASAWASVAKNDSGTNNVTTASSVTSLDLTTFTVSAGSNLCLVGLVATTGSPTGITLTWDNGGTNQVMHSEGSALQANAMVTVFSLTAPTAGNKTLHATWTNASAGASVAAIAFSGASNPTGVSCVVGTDTVTSNVSSGSTQTITVTSTTDGATVAAFANPTAFFNSLISGTLIYNDGTGNFGDAGTYTIGGTSDTHTVGTASSVAYAAAGVHIAAAGGGGGGTKSVIVGGGVF